MKISWFFTYCVTFEISRNNNGYIQKKDFRSPLNMSISFKITAFFSIALHFRSNNSNIQKKRLQVSFKQINQFKKYGIFLHFLPKMIFTKMINYGCFWPAVISLKQARNYGGQPHPCRGGGQEVFNRGPHSSINSQFFRKYEKICPHSKLKFN